MTNKPLTLVLLITLLSASNAVHLRTKAQATTQVPPHLEYSRWVIFYNQPGFTGDYRLYNANLGGKDSSSISNFKVKSMRMCPNCCVVFNNEYVCREGDQSTFTMTAPFNFRTSSKCMVGIYEDINWQGAKALIYMDTPDLRTLGWNDRISSYAMGDVPCYFFGYEDINYGGAEYSNLVPSPYDLGAWNDRISSIRLIPQDAGCYLEIFSDANYQGAKRFLTPGTHYIQGVSSFKLMPGCIANFDGNGRPWTYVGENVPWVGDFYNDKWTTVVVADAL